MGWLRGNDFLISETADAALLLVIEDTDAGAVGTENPVGQIGGKVNLKFAAALTTEKGVRQSFGAALRAGRQFQIAAAVGAVHGRPPRLVIIKYSLPLPNLPQACRSRQVGNFRGPGQTLERSTNI
jgi:hypothetical protein